MSENIRREDFLDDNNAVMTGHDYAEVLKAEFDMEIQSEEFGFNCNLSIEGIPCEYHNKHHNYVRNKGKMKMNFHSHFQMILIIMQLLNLNIRKSLFSGFTRISC